MFTGIVQQLGQVSSVQRTAAGVRYKIIMSTDQLNLGASVAVDGVCQTVVATGDNEVCFDAIFETLSVTTLSDLEVGQKCNIERSLKMGDEIGGHEVSGHVTGVAQIAAIAGERWRIECKPTDMPYILDKGFVAVDGISLTVNNPTESGFELTLIPETLARTTLGIKKVGDWVNIEPCWKTRTIVDTVRKFVMQAT